MLPLEQRLLVIIVLPEILLLLVLLRVLAGTKDPRDDMACHVPPLASPVWTQEDMALGVCGMPATASFGRDPKSCGHGIQVGGSPGTGQSCMG